MARVYVNQSRRSTPFPTLPLDLTRPLFYRGLLRRKIAEIVLGNILGTLRMPRPTFDRSTGWWFFIWRDQAGRRVKSKLGKDHRWKKPGDTFKTPPPDIALVAREFEDRARRARKGEVVSEQSSPLSDFLATYRASYIVAQRAEGSLRMLDVATRQLMAYCQSRGITTIQAVSKLICRDFLEDQAAAGKKRNTLESKRGLLGAAFTRAEEDGLIPRNPWAKIKIPGRKRTEESMFWSEDECAAIATHLDGWCRDLFLVGIHSGFRVDGLSRLRWRDVLWTDPASPLGSLWCRTAKGSKPYRIPLFPGLRSVLEARQAAHPEVRPDDFIFPGSRPGQPVSREAIDDRIRVAMARAGIPDRGRRCHAMRETFGTRCAAKGVHLRTLMAWMNHANLKMTLKYAHYDRTTEASEASKLD